MSATGRPAPRCAAAVVATVLAVGCGGGPASQAPGPASIVPATYLPSPADGASPPEPSPQPTFAPPEVPTLEDAAFLESSRTTCDSARPDAVYRLDGPAKARSKHPGYTGLHIAVLEMRDADGNVSPPPPHPPDDAYYPNAGSVVTIPGATERLAVEAPFSSWVDVLACVILRAGETSSYSAQRELRVTALDAIVWLVDRASGAPVGQPWVVEAGVPTFLNQDNLVRVDGRLYNVAPARPAIAYALGLAVPLPGAYHGGPDSFVVAEFDKPADLPPGTRLLPGVTFVLRLVVFDTGRGLIDFVEILCAPVGIVAGEPLRVAAAVPHDIGAFSAPSADVVIEGEFTTETQATGTIKGLSGRARNCGIPASATWYVGLALQARPGDGGYVLLP